MKIEIGESAIYSWLRHIKNCKIVQTNWKRSPLWDIFNEPQAENLFLSINQEFPEVFKKSSLKQLLKQGEIDVLGVEFSKEKSSFYAVEVAFHEAGLHYKDSIHNVIKKMLRSALILYTQFNTKYGEIIFATPKISRQVQEELQEAVAKIQKFMKQKGFFFHFSLIFQSDFQQQILLPLLQKAQYIADTSELFMRSYQLFSLSKIK